MGITINNGVANIFGTPGAISGVFANRPAAPDQADGTLYFATDTLAIYQVVAGAWVNYSGGGGGGITSASNGLTKSGTDVQLGGTLTKKTVINANNFDFEYQNGGKFNVDCLSANFTSNTDKPFLKSDGSSTFIGLENAAGSQNVYSEYDFNNKIIKTVYNNYENGLKINFDVLGLGGFNYIFGDIQNQGNGVKWIVDDYGSRIFAGYPILDGIELDLLNKSYTIGDLINNTYLQLTNVFFTTKYLGNDIGINLDFTNQIYSFGDGATATKILITNIDFKSFYLNDNVGLSFDYVGDTYKIGNDVNGFGNTLSIGNLSNEIILKNDELGNQLYFYLQGGTIIKTNFNTADRGIYLDYTNDQYYFGDTVTNFGVDRAVTKLIASSNLLVGTSGPVSGQHLKINVGGTDYVIELRDP